MQNKNYIIEITLLIISFAYFFFWNKYCSSKVEFNNESIEFAINTFNFTPYVSYYLYLIVDYFFSKNLMSILGNVLIPSFVFLMIFKIFEKLLINKLWAISISLLSISSTENYPFINFFINFITGGDYFNHINLQNFEIQGFPIPSFSILYFLIIYYFSIKNFFLTNIQIYILTVFWFLSLYVHPLDGILGSIFWFFYISLRFILKKNITIKNFYIIIGLLSINLIVFYFQIDFKSIIKLEVQDYKSYHFLVYFIIPIILLMLTINYLKVDKIEFLQKFLSIYILMISELILILLSIFGLGIEMKILGNRITMFLLHFLYYVPVIYYLRRDFITYNQYSDKTKSVKKSFLLKILYYSFNKYSFIYLIPINIIMILYYILTISHFYE